VKHGYIIASLREVLPAGYHFFAKRDIPNNNYDGAMIAAKDNLVNNSN